MGTECILTNVVAIRWRPASGAMAEDPRGVEKDRAMAIMTHGVTSAAMRGSLLSVEWDGERKIIGGGGLIQVAYSIFCCDLNSFNRS